MVDQVRTVSGEIIKVTSINEKEITTKEGKKTKLFSIGIQLDDGSWHNISTFDKDKVADYLIDTLSVPPKVFLPGDFAEIYEQSRDGKYWNITSIVRKMTTSPKTLHEDKIELGQAKNIAAAIIAEHEFNTDEEMLEKYALLVGKFYRVNKDIRKQLLGE